MREIDLYIVDFQPTSIPCSLAVAVPYIVIQNEEDICNHLTSDIINVFKFFARRFHLVFCSFDFHSPS